MQGWLRECTNRHRWGPALVMEPPAGYASSYLDPLTDFGFKRIFGTPKRKKILLHFLNSLLRGKKVIKEGQEIGLKNGLEKGLKNGLKNGLEKGLAQGREEGREEKDRIFIQNLITGTGFNDKKIATLAGVEVRLVKRMRAGTAA